MKCMIFGLGYIVLNVRDRTEFKYPFELCFLVYIHLNCNNIFLSWYFEKKCFSFGLLFMLWGCHVS